MNKDIVKCRCGWWSIDPRFDLAYHRQKHTCTQSAPKRVLARGARKAVFEL